MKLSWNCISWKERKEKFHSVSLPSNQSRFYNSSHRSKYFSFLNNAPPASWVTHITRDFLICYFCSNCIYPASFWYPSKYTLHLRFSSYWCLRFKEVLGTQNLIFWNPPNPKGLTMYKQLYTTSVPRKPWMLQLLILRKCVVNIDSLFYFLCWCRLFW